jgi:glycosyltransferase involved in cell wall biosynthesis
MKPIVSVSIATFNHAPFISRSIDGALMQKTNFPFEIVIGEDCSTDGTREMVKEYAQKYPGKIRMITSETNVGGTENSLRTDFACQGDFIAYCEGDDYWIDPTKLQKQYQAIEQFNAVLVAHASLVVKHQNNKRIDVTVNIAQNDPGFIEVEDIILKRKNFETSSFFIRAEIAKNLPDWYKTAPVGDVPIKLIAAEIGKVYYLPDIMSVYQKGLTGSWSDRKEKSKLESGMANRKEFEKEYIQMFKNFDAYSNYKYSEALYKWMHARSASFLIKYKNFDYLDITDQEKIIIRTLAPLLQFLPNRIKYPLATKLARKYIPHRKE